MNRRALLLGAALAAVTLVAQWSAPLSAWAVGGGSHRVVVENSSKPLSPSEIRKIESYMRQVFGNQGIRLVHVAPDAEVWLGEHFLGIVFPDDQREGRTFYFEMAIFDDEVDQSPPARRGR
jgi:hypothetical protein